MTIKFFLLVPLLCFFGCKSITHKQETDHHLPEIGSIGNYQNFALSNNYKSNTVVPLEVAIRLNVEKVTYTKRKLFLGKEEIPKVKTMISLSVLDKVGLIEQVNLSQNIIEYLRLAKYNSIVTASVISFPTIEELRLLNAEEVYLVRNKEKTLSLELRNNNKVSRTIEFSQGDIIEYDFMDFCWGKNRKNRIEIFDIIEKNTSCKKPLYDTAAKAKKKTEFKF